jgi:carboxymethylenebutenolidase
MRAFLSLSVVSALTLSSACTIQRQAGDDHMAMMSAADRAVPNVNPAAAQDAPQGHAGLPASASTAAARLAASPRHAEWVKIPWGPDAADSLMAWIVYPVTDRPQTPVVVVVHEIFGLTTWVRAVADQAAADGFIAIAPDLVSRARGGPSSDELTGDSARRIIRAVGFAERNLGISAAARYAMSLPSAAPRYAVFGFCWGGSTTWGHAVHGGIPGFSAGVAFYGAPYAVERAPDADSLAKIRVPVMLLNGDKDARIGAMMPAIDSVMRAMGKDYVGRNYEGAIHGFMRAQDDPRPERDVAEEQANLAAARDAWARTLAFLREHLGIG